MASELAQLAKPELLERIERMKSMARNAAKRAEKPMIQGLHGVSAVGGAAVGGLIAGIRPHVFRVPTDAVLGLVIALPCLAVAGSGAGDVGAQIGWGMLAGATGRETGRAARNWREQRAADGGDSAAQQIVALQKQLDDLRKQREQPPAK
jgi:hypothetical protein